MPDTDAHRDLTAMIATHGHAVIQVFPHGQDTRADFTYTVGLSALAHPELVIEGMPQDAAAGLLNDLADRVHAGDVLRGGDVLTDIVDDGAGGPVPFPLLDVIDTTGLDAVEGVYGEVRAVQVVVPDSTARLPWHPGHRNAPDLQRLRGRLTPAQVELPAPPAAGVHGKHDADGSAWQVPALSQDDVVLVSARVLAGERVTSVWHHAGGAWTFTGDDHTAARPTPPLVGIYSALLEHLDQDLAVVAGLPAGVRATRSAGLDWVRWPDGSA